MKSLTVPDKIEFHNLTVKPKDLIANRWETLPQSGWFEVLYYPDWLSNKSAEDMIAENSMGRFSYLNQGAGLLIKFEDRNDALMMKLKDNGKNKDSFKF